MIEEGKMESHMLFIERLRQELQKELPGAEAQFKMAPGLRLKIKPGPGLKKAAVLILLYPHGELLQTVFIRRSKYPGVHGGQISLPGGKMENNDTNVVVTALRESEEEIGIISRDVDILGQITQLFIPVSNVMVFPVIGYIPYRPEFHPHPDEVAELIETPVEEFLRLETIQDKIMIIRLKRAIVPFYNIRGHHIWGATAMIISEFTELLGKIMSHH